RENLIDEEINISYKSLPNSFELVVAHAGEGERIFSIRDFYPNGNVDGRGNDVQDSLKGTFLADFAHLTISLKKGEIPAFYLNGRNIDGKYLENLPEKVTD